MCSATARPAHRPGLTQHGRYLGALAPSSAPLDERSMATLMAQAPEFARLLNYFDASGKAVSDWQPFWESDPCFFMAQLALHGATKRHGGQDAPSALAAIHADARLINGWQQQVADQALRHLAQGGNPLEAPLATAIGQLGPILNALLTVPPWREEWQRLEAALPAPQAPWSPLWRLGDAATAATSPVRLPPFAASFASAVASLVNQARQGLDQMLARADHPPHAALYLAFLRLLVSLQDDMNRFTARHLEYYYEAVLRMTPLPGTADRATIVFSLAANCPQYLLPGGSTLSAGQDSSGQAILYALDRDLALNQASLAAIRTVALFKDSSGAVRSARAAPVADSQDGLGAPLANPALGWPTFGAATSGQAAEQGCIFAAPALDLQDGASQITVHLQFGADAGAVMDVWQPLAAGADASQPQRQALPPAAFLVFLSGAAGWIPVTDLRIVRLRPGSDWLLRLKLPAGHAPVVANPGLAPGLDCAWPMLKLVLNPAAGAYPYTELSALVLSAATIRVKSWNLTQLQMSGPSGTIAAGKPFTPYGAAPLPGMNWTIGCPALAGLALAWLRIDIAWLNLPLVGAVPMPVGVPNGFPAYYAGYSPFVFQNAMFEAGLALQRAGAWQAMPAALPLFTDVQGALQANTCWTLHFAGAPVQDGLVRATFSGPPYGFGQAQYPTLFAARAIENIKALEPQPKSGGFWQMAGQAASKAAAAIRAAISRIGGGIKALVNKIRSWFGKSATAAASSAPTAAPTSAPVLPAGVVLLNPPFVPTISTVTLSYKSITAVPLGAATADAAFYHVHPFGAAPAVQPSLYPLEPGSGNLYLGFAALAAGQSINLHIELREADAAYVHLSLPAAPQAAAPGLSWRYLAGDNWCEFAPGSVSSGVDDMARSGIVTLSLPAGLPPAGCSMGAPGKTPLTWIAVSTSEDPASFAATIDLLPQAGTVVRQTPPAAGQGEPVLAPGTIAAMSPGIAAIKSLSQPYPSSGGQAAEDGRTFHARISERLRHKQRASQLRDYEQLVLSEFPAVWQAKCIGPNNSRGYVCPPLAGGQVALVLAPPVQDQPDQGAPFHRPQLAAIGAYVESLASHCLSDLWIRNVVYETLTVHADVQYRPGADLNQSSAQLNDALCDFLSPWLRQTVRQLEIGSGSVPVAGIAALIRGLPFVASLNALVLVQEGADLNPLQMDETATARPRLPWSALVPAPRHVFGPVTAVVAPAPAAAPVVSPCFLSIPRQVVESACS